MALFSEARLDDANSALGFLSKDSFVDPRRIALIKFSSSGTATLEAVQLGGAEEFMERTFNTAVAYYPDCSHTWQHGGSDLDCDRRA